MISSLSSFGLISLPDRNGIWLITPSKIFKHFNVILFTLKSSLDLVVVEQNNEKMVYDVEDALHSQQNISFGHE